MAKSSRSAPARSKGRPSDAPAAADHQLAASIQNAVCAQAGCQAACMTDCMTHCQVSCQAACDRTCQASCTASCTALCQTSCQTACTQGCTTSCTKACTTSCTSGCTGGCTGSCTGGCTTGSCTTDCVVLCATGCEVSCTACETGCTSGCTGGGCEGGCQQSCTSFCEFTATSGCCGPGSPSESQRFRLVNDLACDAGCEAADELYSRIVQGFFRNPRTLTPADDWLSARVMHSNFSIPVVGEIVGGGVVVELDRASFRPDRTVSVMTAAGRQITGTSISTAVIAFHGPIEAPIDVAGAEKETCMTGMLLLAEGSYRKGEGIVVEKGTKATILAQAKAYTGSISREIRIARDKFEMAAAPVSRTRGIAKQAPPTSFVDNWLTAKVMYSEVPLPVAAEIVEGKVQVESDKASFAPDTIVSAITAYGKHVTGTNVSTAAIAFRVPIEAVIDMAGEEKQTSIGGLLLLAEGSYRKDEGVVIRKGTKTTILLGAKAYTGAASWDIRIPHKMLETSGFRPGLRRLTQ